MFNGPRRGVLDEKGNPILDKSVGCGGRRMTKMWFIRQMVLSRLMACETILTVATSGPEMILVLSRGWFLHCVATRPNEASLETRRKEKEEESNEEPQESGGNVLAELK